MANKEIIKRREQVYDLCILKATPVSQVARTMNVRISTIRSDMDHLNKVMTRDLMEMGHGTLLVQLIEDQRQRIFKRINDDIPETARCKYESLLMESNKALERYYEKLTKLTQKTTDRKLEDQLAESSFTRFNEIIGLPRHPFTKLPGKITQAQMKFHSAIDPVKRSWIVLNKTRQGGFTDIALRDLAYYSFTKYAGKKIALVAGTRVETTVEIFNRLKALYRNISETRSVIRNHAVPARGRPAAAPLRGSRLSSSGWSG